MFYLVYNYFFTTGHYRSLVCILGVTFKGGFGIGNSSQRTFNSRIALSYA
jgi:hypothetical protein